MADSLLRITQAARKLDIPTKELLVLIREGKIGYAMRDGIAHVPGDAIDGYRTKVS